MYNMQLLCVRTATPSPGLSPMHRSLAKAAAHFPPDMLLSTAAAAVGTPPLVGVSEPGTPVGQAVPEYTDVTALLLGDSMEPLNGAPNGAR